jgi:hypothetical protein
LSGGSALLRNVLLIALVAVWAYSSFCALMVMLHRSGSWRWFTPVWSGRNLSPTGLAYRRRHGASVVVGFALAIVWFLFVEPL